jgi:hypothetical protein
LKTEEKLWSGKGICSALELKGATRGFVTVLPNRDLFFTLASQVDSSECKLWVKDLKLSSDRFNAPTSRLLALHNHHRKGTTMHRILVLWDRAIVVVRVSTIKTGVQESRPIRLQLQAQIRTSTVIPTTVHLLHQGRTKVMLM